MRGFVAMVVAACGGDEGRADRPSSPSDPADPPVDSGAPADSADSGSSAVDGDGDGFTADVDCDDADRDVYPGAPDRCGDDRVTDCDRTSDDGLVTVDGNATFVDLAAALASAAAGAEVRVCPGTWVGPFVATAPVSLSSTGGSGETVLSGAGLGTTLVVPGGSEVVGFTIQDGVGEFGGGLATSSAGTLHVQGCVFRLNHAEDGGGIALAPDTVASVEWSDLLDNTADGRGGGLFVAAGASADLPDTIVADNEAAAGGGAALDGGALTSGSFHGNVATGPDGGGGLATWGSASVDGAYLELNSAGSGGGVATRDAAALVSLQLNENSATDALGLGGGVWCDGCAATMVDASLFGNAAPRGGGNLAVVGGSVVGSGWLEEGSAEYGGGIWLEDGVVTGFELWANRADVGGGVFASGLASTLSATTIDSSDADQGGGVATEAGALDLSGVTLTANVAATGGGVSLLGAAALAVTDGAFGVGAEANHPSDVFAGGAEYLGYGAGVTFACDAGGCSPAPGAE